jgi:hypothetical protein
MSIESLEMFGVQIDMWYSTVDEYLEDIKSEE